MHQLPSTSRMTGRGFAASRVQFPRPVEFARHHHAPAHLVLVYRGRWFDHAQRPVDLQAGEILFHPANTDHENRSLDGADLIIADLEDDFVSAFFPLYGGSQKSLAFGFQAFDDLPERLYEEIIGNDASTVLVVESLLVQMLAIGARMLGARNGQPDWLSRVTSHIHRHAHQPLTVSSLAEIGSVSLSRLSHGFREHTGKSITAYIREYRLRIAARALRQTHRPIKDIALSYGFYDHAHFSREFIKVHGLPPIEYRRRTQMHAASEAAEACAAGEASAQSAAAP